MKEQLVHALKTKYDADYQMHKANLDIYLNNPVGIGEHPQHFEEMDKFNYSINQLRESLYNDDFIQMMKFEVDRAKRYFESGSRLLSLVDTDSRICLVVLSTIYRKILKKIERSNYNIFQTNYRLNTFEKLSIMGFTWLRYKITKK